MHGEWSLTTRSMSPLAQPRPERVAVGGVADRRAALELGGAVGDRAGLEVQVVRAGLHGDVDAGRPGRAQGGDRAGRAEVHDVGAAAGGAGGVDDEGDRPLLGDLGPARQEPVVRRPVGARGDGVAVLGVHDHQRAEPGGLGHRRGEVGRRQVRELLDAGVEQEALEPEDARLVQPGEVGAVGRHRTAPEADVDPGLAGGDRTLLLERGDGRGRRDAVERHVDDRRHAAGGGGAGRAGEPLPLGAPGLVDVHVGVDEAGEQHLVGGELDDVGVARGGVVRARRRRSRPSRTRTAAARSAPPTTARRARRTGAQLPR